jgi:hypothetical protein
MEIEVRDVPVTGLVGTTSIGRTRVLATAEPTRITAGRWIRLPLDTFAIYDQRQ